MSDELLKYLDMRIALCKEDNHDHVGFRLDEIERLRAELEKKRDLLGKANALARIRLDRVADLEAELAKREAVAVPDIIDKVMDYGRDISNAAVCEAAYDKMTARMHRKEAGDTLAEITAMLAAKGEAK